ncbi:MAG TPA: alpha/beta hydrolase, partial [Candidatus Limnocylindria bacterium]
MSASSTQPTGSQSSSPTTGHWLPRRAVTSGVAAAAAALVGSVLLLQPTAASTRTPTPKGPGSVSGAPNLPPGFTETFNSRYIDANGLRMHVVIGGEGPPLLLIHGWPQTWYAWRMVMPALARDFQVIAVDQRGIGLTDKPRGGYDTGSQANDLVALRQALGHQRFAVYGTDTGMPIAYALAADHPD